MKTSSLTTFDRDAVVTAVNRWFTQHQPAEASEAVVISGGEALTIPELQARGRMRFLLGACQYPAGLLDNRPAYASFARMAERIERDREDWLALILTGDQIYMDVTAGLFDPTQLDDGYRRAYERWLHQAPIRRLMSRLPALCMLDDHEIHDNWEPVSPDNDEELIKLKTEALELGRDNYRIYQRASGPFPDAVVGDLPEKRLWCSLAAYGLPVFLADTRTERQHRHAGNLEQARIMSDTQFEALTSWLQNEELRDLPKIIVSPSIMLPRHSRIASRDHAAGNMTGPAPALLSDGWDGYPASMHSLLALIAREKISNVVFLSGDEHLGCAARATLSSGTGSNDNVLVHSIHSSALYSPYPFANGRPSDLMAGDSFSFSDGKASLRYQCSVEASFYPGEGFSLLEFHKETDGNWRLDCEFERTADLPTQRYSALLG